MRTRILSWFVAAMVIGAVAASAQTTSDSVVTTHRIVSSEAVDTAVAASFAATPAVSAPAAQIDPRLIKVWLFIKASIGAFDGYTDADAEATIQYAEHLFGSSPMRTPIGSEPRAAQTQTAGSAWAPSLVGQVRLVHSNGASALNLTGGLRETNKTNSKYQLYVQGQAGLWHDSFDNAFMIAPGAGVVVPLEGKKFVANAGVDVPITFFSGYAAHGFSFYAGIGLPLGNQ